MTPAAVKRFPGRTRALLAAVLIGIPGAARAAGTVTDTTDAHFDQGTSTDAYRSGSGSQEAVFQEFRCVAVSRPGKRKRKQKQAHTDHTGRKSCTHFIRSFFKR